jgi:hypothetical protein
MSRLPNNNPAFLDTNGRVSLPWFYWFQSLVGPGQPITPITVTASPSSFTANENGSFVISGGTVSNIQITRGVTTIAVGFTSGIVPVKQNDIVIVTWTVIPTVNFIPG